MARSIFADHKCDRNAANRSNLSFRSNTSAERKSSHSVMSVMSGSEDPNAVIHRVIKELEQIVQVDSAISAQGGSNDSKGSLPSQLIADYSDLL